jgi:methylenetetrahydrofolate dehydrogenase (NADP+)/methenyltetrahydrofolate cyclohydrolase
MSAQIIDGKMLASRIRERTAQQVAEIRDRLGRPPGLAVIQVGEDPASQIYVRNKRNTSVQLGLNSFAYDLPADTREDALLALVTELNRRPDVDGILVQLPLPASIRADRIVGAIDPLKDVDGLHPLNLGWLCSGHPRLVSCTPAGIMEIIRSTDTVLKGKHAVVVGRSNMVGKPTAMLLLNEHATVEICHSRTRDLAAECRRADILVAAVGQPRLIPGAWVKPGAIVVDVGTTRLPTGLCGDVIFEEAKEVAAFITPVPGGVGPMTIAMLMHNTVRAVQLREEHE